MIEASTVAKTRKRSKGAVTDCAPSDSSNLIDKASLVCSECKSAMNFKALLNKYMLTDEVWIRVHPEGYKGFLCHKCLLNRVDAILGRPLTANDFTICSCFVNRHVHGLTTAEASLLAQMRRCNLSSMNLTNRIVDTISRLREDEKNEDHLAKQERIDVKKAYGVNA